MTEYYGLIELVIKQTALTAESLQSLSLFTSRLYVQRFSSEAFAKQNYSCLPDDALCTFSTNSPAPALLCYNSPFLIPRPHAILENDKDVHTRTVGISLRVHSFQARVSGQIFVCREFRPIKFDYYSRVLSCVHALAEGFWGYIRRVE